MLSTVSQTQSVLDSCQLLHLVRHETVTLQTLLNGEWRKEVSSRLSVLTTTRSSLPGLVSVPPSHCHPSVSRFSRHSHNLRLDSCTCPRSLGSALSCHTAATLHLGAAGPNVTSALPEPYEMGTSGNVIELFT